MRLVIERFAATKFGTLGTLSLESEGVIVDGYTVELPWRGNRRNESCIPPGIYRAQRHDSPKFGTTYWIRDVPDRSEILVHAANSQSDLDGCIGPGADYGWWDDRNELAVWDSRKTLDLLLGEGADEIDVEIYYWTPEYP